MSEEGFLLGAAVFGAVVTAIVIFFGQAIISDGKAKECARLHNVYACEKRIEYVPITNPADSLPPPKS